MMKITIEYSNKIYNFEHGYETYIFCAAVNNEFDKTHPDELKDFIYNLISIFESFVIHTISPN